MGKRNVVANSSRNDANFIGPDEETSKLGPYVEDSVLENDQEIAVGRVEGGMGIHGFPSGEDEHAETLLHGRVARSGDKVQGVHPVHRLVEIEGVPSKLVWNVMELGRVRARVVRCRLSRLEWRVRSSG